MTKVFDYILGFLFLVMAAAMTATLVVIAMQTMISVIRY